MYRKLSTMVSRGLEGKVCVITASTDGIGYAIAKRLGLDGANIVVSSRKKENVEKAVKCLQNDGVKSSNILGVPCHVAKASDRQRLFDETLKKFGGIDALISNAVSCF
jgi:dehydrogenase/reductase SDR family member 4